MALQSSRRLRRRGTTTVEAAAVLPVFFAFVFSIIQLGHASMIKHLLQNGCRTAARMGSTEGVTSTSAIAEAKKVTSRVAASSKITVIIKDASVYDDEDGNLPVTNAQFNALPNLELSTADSRQLFLVRAQVNYNDVALLPMPFTQNLTLTAQAFMRHE